MLSNQSAPARDAGPPLQMLKASEVMRCLNLSRASFDALIRRGLLSPGVDLGPGCRRWDLEEVRALIASRKVRVTAHAA